MAFHLIEAAYAQEAGAGAATTSAVSSVIQIAPIIGMCLVFYFLLIRPQQLQQKQMKASRAALKRGDRIVTGGGVVGTVQKTRDSEVDVEIAPNVRVTVLRDTIGSVLKPAAAND